MPPLFRNPAGNAQLGYNRRRAAGPDGETGRRIGLKIRRGQPHAGSIPAPGTKAFATNIERVFAPQFSRRSAIFSNA